MMLRATTCLLFGLGGTFAQQDSFHVQTKVVQVPVIVTNKNGQTVDGLTSSDFKVLDNGLPQDVTVDDFSSGLAPVSLAIAVQTAGISAPALAKVRAIGSTIQPLVTGERGEAAVVTFDSKIRWPQDFTSDGNKVYDAVKNLRASSSPQEARMLDAIVAIASRMEQCKGRKMILVISESRDRGSESTVRQALKAVEGQSIEVFAAHYSAYTTAVGAKAADIPPQTTELQSDDPTDGPPEPPGVNILAMLWEMGRLTKTNAVQALTEASGGADFPFLKQRGIENAIEKLGLEVHSQYMLSFPQLRDEPGMHKIDVSTPQRADLRIRARRAYWVETARNIQ